jgi:hypothetical protein
MNLTANGTDKRPSKAGNSNFWKSSFRYSHKYWMQRDDRRESKREFHSTGLCPITTTSAALSLEAQPST